MIVRRVVHTIDARSGTAPYIKKALRYVFPDHWSFMLGEVALYAFVWLVATGIFLTFFFDPSYQDVVYDGKYEPLQGRTMSQAYKSVVDISFDVKAGLLMRQTHHWGANVFVGAIVLHLVRVFLTGAFRKPRQWNYYGGLLILIVAMVEGYFGYSQIDDLYSGMGLAIGYSVLLAVPFVGPNLALLFWEREFPGTTDFEVRLYIFHVLIFPVLIGLLIALHLGLLVMQHHTQFRGGKRRQSNVVGTPMWPAYALRSAALLLFVGAMLLLLGGLVQINPVWLWGPYETWLATNAAQPDWYLGWLIGALRLMPAWEPTIGDYTVVPNAFWGGVFFPFLVFAVLFLWPTIERKWITKDDRFHHLLDRPRDNPVRTGIGIGFFSWVAAVTFAGSFDRAAVQLHIPYASQINVLAVAQFVLPFVFGAVAYVWAKALKESEAHPLREWSGVRVRRTPDGGFEEFARAPNGKPRETAEPQREPTEPRT